MNANKSEIFLNNWEKDEKAVKRKLTEFSLQLIPNKFPEMINYKKILMENLEPSDFECTVLENGTEIAELVTDSKIKSLYLKKASEQIKILEKSLKEPDEVLENIANDELLAFEQSFEVKNFAYGTKVVFTKDIKSSKVVVNDIEINGLEIKKGHEFDVLTFKEGFLHTFLIRLELESGDKFAFFSSVGRDGVKGEKPKVYVSACIDGYYVSKITEIKVY